MIVVRVKDRGRDLATHRVEFPDEARELQRVYVLLGYSPERISVEAAEEAPEKAA